MSLKRIVITSLLVLVVSSCVFWAPFVLYSIIWFWFPSCIPIYYKWEERPVKTFEKIGAAPFSPDGKPKTAIVQASKSEYPLMIGPAAERKSNKYGKTGRDWIGSFPYDGRYISSNKFMPANGPSGFYDFSSDLKNRGDKYEGKESGNLSHDKSSHPSDQEKKIEFSSPKSHPKEVKR